MANKFIEYYGEREISPVRQDLTNVNVHYAKREKLYRQLGVAPIAFEGKQILEVGPGSGYNTLAFFNWGAEKVTLVEPNKTGILEMKKLFAEYEIPAERYEIIEDTIEGVDIDRQFDIVIAEGFLHAIDNSVEIIQRLCTLVRGGGVNCHHMYGFA